MLISKDMKNEKTLLALRKKVCGGGRMPNLNKVADLLKEVGIECSVMNWSCMKYGSAAGLRYTTSGGSREYNGYRLKVPQINMDIDSTETYYSWNTKGYAEELVKLIDTKL
mgnify:CR=1 FL=1